MSQNHPSTVPGPRPMPVLGSWGNFMSLMRDPIATMGRLFKTYGRVAALAAGGGPIRVFSTNPDCPGVVFVYSPELVRAVEAQHDLYHKSPLTGLYYPAEGAPPRQAALRHFISGLFAVNGNEHRRQRRLLAPAFHKKHIASYYDHIVSLTQQTLDRWRPGERLNVHHAMQQLTLRVVVKTLFGGDLDSAMPLGEKLQEVMHRMLEPATFLARYDLPGTPYRRVLTLVSEIERGVRGLIEQKQASGANDGDMLSMLLAARDEEDGSGLTEDEIVGHASLIFVAGHETSSVALTMTLFLLSQHPRFAADLYTELNDLLHGAPPTLEQLNQVPLLDYTIKESLRLLPPAVWNMRTATEPTELGGYRIPKDTEVIASIYHTHHMSELYEQPETFNPYRWVSLERDTFEYNPFGGGPRMCIGSGFAMMEMKIVLAMLLQRYRLEFIPGTAVDRFVLGAFSLKHGLPMLVQPQDCRFDQGVGGVRGDIREMVDLPT